MHLTIRVIIDEHAALAAMLRSVLLLLREPCREDSRPNFTAMRAMLFYLDEFPEKQHHRKESDILFPKLRGRTPLARGLLDRLDYEHERGGRAIRDVEHALLAFEIMGTPRRRAFETTMQSYVDFYLAHMRLEEQEILPLAQRVLSLNDWAELDEAFSENFDPLVGCATAEDYGALFTRIVTIVPEPVGLGPAR